MSGIDVRNLNEVVIDKIIFADHDAHPNVVQGSHLEHHGVYGAKIRDNTSSFIYITSVEQANNLKKALDKAIELGWFK